LRERLPCGDFLLLVAVMMAEWLALAAVWEWAKLMSMGGLCYFAVLGVILGVREGRRRGTPLC
jgi:hypothetical protein